MYGQQFWKWCKNIKNFKIETTNTYNNSVIQYNRIWDVIIISTVDDWLPVRGICRPYPVNVFLALMWGLPIIIVFILEGRSKKRKIIYCVHDNNNNNNNMWRAKNNVFDVLYILYRHYIILYTCVNTGKFTI